LNLYLFLFLLIIFDRNNFDIKFKELGKTTMTYFIAPRIEEVDLDECKYRLRNYNLNKWIKDYIFFKFSKIGELRQIN